MTKSFGRYHSTLPHNIKHHNIQMESGITYIFHGCKDDAVRTKQWEYAEQDQFCRPANTTKTTKQIDVQSFRYDKHGAGAIAIAAKAIAEGKVVSFDCYKIIEKFPLPVQRKFCETVFIGLATLDDEPAGSDICVRHSHCIDLLAVHSSSIIASWNGRDIATDPVHIAANLSQYLSQWNNVFLND